MTTANETLTGGPALAENPEPAQPETAEVQDSAQDNPVAAGGDDFASALENFTTETEDSVGDDHVIHGTVIKLTSTHVVVDIGAKSEGMLPIAEVQDHEGKSKFQAGDPI